MNCPRCATINLDGSVVCASCGAQLPAAGPPPGAPPYGTPMGAAPGYPAAGYGPPPGYYPPYGTPGVYMQPARSGTILVLGILSLVVCSILGPIAWSMGNEELRRIDRGEVDPTTRSNVNAGRICGMISSILMIVSLVLVVVMFVAAAGSSR